MKRQHIIILAAGRSLKMKGQKCLVKIHDEAIIRRQFRILSKIFKNPQFVVVFGYESAQIKAELAGLEYKPAFNCLYEETGPPRSILEGLRVCPKNRPVLVVYGDLVFGKDLKPSFKNVCDRNRSWTFVQQSTEPDDISINILDGKATLFSYGLAWKWSQILQLDPPERALFEEAVRRAPRSLLTHEILNMVIGEGGQIDTQEVSGIVEIDTAKHVQEAELSIN